MIKIEFDKDQTLSHGNIYHGGRMDIGNVHKKNLSSDFSAGSIPRVDQRSSFQGEGRRGGEGGGGGRKERRKKKGREKMGGEKEVI